MEERTMKFLTFGEIMLRLKAPGPVSYTHLDVYKRQPKHCGNFCHGEHQRKLIIACVDGMLHSVLPFLMRRATNSPRTACAEFAAALLYVQSQTVDVCEKFQRPHGSA